MASVGQDRAVKIWDTDTGLRERDLWGHAGEVWGVAFSKDGRRIASGSHDGTVKLWDPDSGEELRTLRGHAGQVWAVAISADGRRVASGGTDQTVRVWDAETGRGLLTLTGHSNTIVGVAFSPDGRQVASGSWDSTVRLWDAGSGEVRRVLGGQGAGFGMVAFSPDGRLIAAASWDHTLKLWDVTTGAEVRALRGHTAPVIGVAFSPDGRRLASASWDHTVKVWDAEMGQEYLTLSGHESSVIGVAFSPDGRLIASGSWDGRVRLWDARPVTDEVRALHEARGVARSLADQWPSSYEVVAPTHKHATPGQDVRRRALAIVGPFVRDHLALEAEYRVETLYRKPMLRDEVIRAQRDDASLGEVERRMALELARRIPEDAERLDQDSWRVVRLPDADVSAYARALRQAEAACRVMPDHGPYLSTLGAARYRAGDDTGALAVLERADGLTRAAQGRPSVPRDLAFLALARHRLGREEEAHAALAQLREELKSPQYAKDQETEALLREAEWIERDHAFPADPFATRGAAGVRPPGHPYRLGVHQLSVFQRTAPRFLRRQNGDRLQRPSAA
jgi:WD40 repeat protein